ncbi:hypothetical protein WKW51_13945 [Acinetobacter baumannii]|uniref:hypothetical protein n=1 Tax=Acinetobacter baumannii TaxID=470 RepID=UPI0025A1594D|nr:hypothetical protein [Acinetobacter baumannii]MDN8152659.1 hypothetical protein [Acinetobacter baumannii]HEE5404883.1 hypothetical protein [Acinetobacter baumannii]HEE5417315.1 hypothetical protein [Acinetobacter baumannii]
MDDKNSDVLFLLVHDFLPAIVEPYSRWVLYKILEAYAGASFEASNKILAIRLGLYERRIAVALKELIAHQILIEPTELADSRNFLKFNEGLFRRYWQVSTRSKYSIEEHYHRSGSMPNELFFYLYKARLNDFYISHTQADKTKLQDKLDFKDALVLLCFIRNANEFGVIENCGITKLKDKTGLSKPSIFRCIEGLKKYGIIRYRLDGIANNRFLNGTHPIFFLNLSHELWMEKRGYGYFYILNGKNQHTFDIYKNYLYIKYFIQNYSDLLPMLERKDSIGITRYIDEQIRSQQCDPLTNSSQYPKKEISNYYDQADQYFLRQLYDLALEIMNSGNGLSHFSYYFEYKTVHAKNSNMNSNMAIMARIHAIFEQWSARNFGNVPAMKKSENGVIFWNHENSSNVQSLIHSLVDDQYSQKADVSFTIYHLQKFIKIFIAMFVKNKIFVFYQALRMAEVFRPFIVVPHSDPQTVCIFQPSNSLSVNVFIQVDFDRVDERLNCREFFPSLEDLKRIGLLPACCETVDSFE